MTNNSRPSVTVVIPNFNGEELLRKNLPSVLEAADCYSGVCSVVVVDDASRDASVAVLKTEFPSVRVVLHGENLGFSGAVHSGVEAAETELLVFLNSDVCPEPDFLAPLMRHFEEPEVFSVSPLVRDPDGRVGEESWRCYEIRHGRFRAVRRPGWVPARAVATLFNSGGSMAVRKSMFQALGGFAPIFKPFYSEDSDLGIRAARRGWRNLMEPGSRVVHDHASSSIKSNVPSARIRRIRRRNQFLLEWIHLPARDLLWRLGPGYAKQALGRLLRMDGVYFAGLLAALRRLPEARRLRNEVGAAAVQGFWDVMADIERDAREAEG
jgi:GT2 family glycosyltransferase